MHAIQRLLLITAVAAALIGCRSVNTAERAQPRAAPDPIALAHLDTDPSLSGDLALVQLNEAELPDGSLKIQAQIHNKKRSPRRFDYRFEWIDESGMTMRSSTTTWKRVNLLGGETTTLTSVAPSPRAVDFRLKLVEAKD